MSKHKLISEKNHMFLHILMFLHLLARFPFAKCSNTTTSIEISLPEFAVDPICPMDFGVLSKAVAEHPPPLRFTDIETECQALLNFIRIIRSLYLGKTGNFTLAPAASGSCWNAFESILHQYVPALNVRQTCGVQTQWISSSCKNVSTRAEFEALVPESQLQEANQRCRPSLEGNSSCAECISSLSDIEPSYFGSNEAGNVSDCRFFPFMYAAALINQFGATNLDTTKCLFSITFSLESNGTNTESPGNSNKHKILIHGVVIGVLLGFGILIIVACLVWWRKKVNWHGKDHTRQLPITASSHLLNESSTLMKFELEELKHATENFSIKNLIGRGGYGNVFKGVLADGSEVALKRFKNSSIGGDAEFAHEVEVIASIKHVNIVGVRGYCISPTSESHQRILVCDFVRNGSLYDHLFGPIGKKLSWPIRSRIAQGIARGLAYLHNGVQPGIIHRDIKASNILLDESYEPKLADFGLAKFTPERFSHLSTRVAGTLGYVSPEYAMYGQLTERSDVYSFGVVLLELLSGKKAVISANGDQILLLTDWAWSLVKDGRDLDIIEDTMPEKGPLEVMEKYVLAALQSVHPSMYARPTMEQILSILERGVGTVPSALSPPLPSVAEIFGLERSTSFPSTAIRPNPNDKKQREGIRGEFHTD